MHRPAPMKVSMWIAVLCFQCFLSPHATSAYEYTAKETQQDHEEKECSIFLAPSSVKGLKGYGVFTTRDISDGSNILMAPDSPSIPVLDYDHAMNDAKAQWIRVFQEYWWARGVPAHVEYQSETAVDFQTTFGALPNHHCILDSLDLRYPKIAYDDSLGYLDNDHRGLHPGAGAFSYHMGREWFVTKDLSAGDEIFLNYGYCEHNDDADDWTAHVFMPEDYEAAARIAWNLFKKSSNDIANNTAADDERITLPNDTSALVAALLPESFSHLRAIVASSPKAPSDSSDFVPLLAKNMASTPRTPEWIRANGVCIENLVPAKSQLPLSGQGAFAQHSIRKGEVVVPAPMLQISDREALRMHNNKDDQENAALEWQLLLNYCFGHEESSMLLCPITNAGLINHCSDRTKECGPDGPNAKAIWSTSSSTLPASEHDSIVISNEWRNITIEEIANESGRGISMDIVALRDISPGEEVFIDYGVEWEDAWQEHVANWEQQQQHYDNEDVARATSATTTAKEANEQLQKAGRPLDFLVTGDLRNVTTFFPDDHNDRHEDDCDGRYLFTACRYWTTRLDRHSVWDEPNPRWVDWYNDEILDTYSDDGSHYYGNYQSQSDHAYWPCSVLFQEEEQDATTTRDDENHDNNFDDSLVSSISTTFTVRIHQADFARDQPWHTNDLPRLLTNYPAQSIVYLVQPYASHQQRTRLLSHHASAFRHAIGILEDEQQQFPPMWKNLAKEGVAID